MKQIALPVFAIAVFIVLSGCDGPKDAPPPVNNEPIVAAPPQPPVSPDGSDPR